MRHMRRFWTAIVFTAIMLATANAEAQRPQPVDIDVPLVTQDTDEWCWLAVAEMIMLERTDRSELQCEMVERRDGLASGWCCEDLSRCARPSTSLNETAQVLAAAGVRTRPGMAVLPSTLYSLLSAGMPVIAQVRNSEGTTHAVVIRGMYYIGFTAILIVNDPMEIAPREIPHSILAVGWINSLIVER